VKLEVRYSIGSRECYVTVHMGSEEVHLLCQVDPDTLNVLKCDLTNSNHNLQTREIAKLVEKLLKNFINKVL